MWSTTTEAISVLACGAWNAHANLSAGGTNGASEIIGVPTSAATVSTASEFAVVVAPRMMSTLSSPVSLRAFLIALVGSVPSSSTMYLTFWPATSAGSSAAVFFCGTPSAAAGPVADTVMPTVKSACAVSAIAAASKPADNFIALFN